MVDTAWKHGGKMEHRQITPDHGVVTSLHLTDKYIVVALDNAKIHVFDTDGNHQKTLQGHVMGVWAMVPWDDVLVSGGCDRDVRVWNMATGYALSSLFTMAFANICPTDQACTYYVGIPQQFVV
jgi:F-box and WD-40 domain protein CDC4